MNLDIKSIIVTRFAMRFSEDSPRRKYEMKPGWVDYRMDLFHKYCLPSVKAQTYKEFDWWFLVHPQFPGFENNHKEILEKYGKILWIEAPWKEEQGEVGESLSKMYNKMWVCSTKLDSDDIIRNNYIELTRSVISKQEAWVTFSLGFMMKNNYAVEHRFTENPFVSHVEYADPMRSIFRVSHIYSESDSKARGIPFIRIDVPGWIQVDHGDNIKNIVTKKIDCFEERKKNASFLHKDFTWNA